MPLFRYEARVSTGERQSGVVTAQTEREAAHQLQDSGLSVMRIQAITRMPALPARCWYALFPISPRILSVFFRRIESYLRAGMTLHDALGRSASTGDDAHLRTFSKTAAASVARGANFAELLRLEPLLFPEHVCSLVEVGLNSGSLEEMCGEIAEQYDVDHTINRTVIWPELLLVFTVLPVPLLLVIWRWLTYYGEFVMTPDKMPPFVGTPFHAATLYWLHHEGASAIVATAAMPILFIGGVIYSRLPGRFSVRDAIILRLPIWGSVVRARVIERCLRVLRAMVRAGQPHADALRSAAMAAGSGPVTSALRAQVEPVRRGVKMSAAIARSQVLPKPDADLLATAEDTGTLDEALTRALNLATDHRQSAVKQAIANTWVTAIVLGLLIAVGVGLMGESEYYKMIFNVTANF